PHVLAAGGEVALGDTELVCPAGDGVLVVAEQGRLVADQVPGAGAAAEGLDLVPPQVTTPAPDRVAAGAAAAAAEQGEAQVLHLGPGENPAPAADPEPKPGQTGP